MRTINVGGTFPSDQSRQTNVLVDGIEYCVNEHYWEESGVWEIAVDHSLDNTMNQHELLAYFDRQRNVGIALLVLGYEMECMIDENTSLWLKDGTEN